LDGLTDLQIATVLAYFRDDLADHGTEIFAQGKAKWLGGGLAEYRFRRNPELLVRLFFFLSGKRLVVVLSGYNKKRDPSDSRQQREISTARKLMRKYR